MSDWGSLEADAKESAFPGPRCSVWILLHELEEKDLGEAAGAVRRTLANVRLTSSGIHKALSARLDADLLPTAQTLTRHRRGACSCKKEGS